MKKVIVLFVCLLMFVGCHSMQKIEITLPASHDPISVDEEYYEEFNQLVEKLSFEETSQYIDEEYTGIYITKGNTVYSYYIYENGDIEFEKNTDKKATKKTNNPEIAGKLLELIEKMQ